MTKITLTAAVFAAFFVAGPLAAQGMAEVADTDGNGTYSMEELKAAYPDLTEEVFIQIDTSGDGEVDDAELEAARDAGLLNAG